VKSLVNGKVVLIRNGDGHEELYDLPNDPLETRNLIDAPEFRPWADQSRRLLDQLLTNPESSQPAQIATRDRRARADSR
jgi:hypothetical protein